MIHPWCSGEELVIIHKDAAGRQLVVDSAKQLCLLQCLPERIVRCHIPYTNNRSEDPFLRDPIELGFDCFVTFVFHCLLSIHVADISIRIVLRSP